MLRQSIPLLLFFGVTSLVLAGNSPKATFYLNGGRVTAASAAGRSLGEIYPLLFEIDRLVVMDAGGETVVHGAEAEASFFASRYDGDLVIGSRTFHDVVSVNVEGSLLDADALSIWLSWEGIDAIEAEIEHFGERYGVDVDVSTIANTRSKLTATERSRATPADVVMIQSDYLPDLLEATALQPLRAGSAPGTALTPGASPFTVNGRLWAEPFYFDSHVVFYNRELLDRAPPDDWTLSDLERIARSSHAEVPLAWNAYSAYWLTPFVVGFGGTRSLGETALLMSMVRLPTARSSTFWVWWRTERSRSWSGTR